MDLWVCGDGKVDFNTFETCDNETACSSTCQIADNSYCSYNPQCNNGSIVTTSDCRVLGDKDLSIAALVFHINNVSAISLLDQSSAITAKFASLANVSATACHLEGVLEIEESPLGVLLTPRTCPSTGSVYSTRSNSTLYAQIRIEGSTAAEASRIAGALQSLTLAELTTALQAATSLGISVSYANTTTILTRDTTIPIGVVSISVQGNSHSSCIAGNGNVVRITLSTNEPVTNVRLPVFNIGTQSRSPLAQGSNSSWYFEYIINGTVDQSGVVTFSIVFEDLAGNSATGQQGQSYCVGTAQLVQVDVSPPIVTIGASDEYPTAGYGHGIDRLLEVIMSTGDASPIVTTNSSMVVIQLINCAENVLSTVASTNSSSSQVQTSFLVSVADFSPQCKARITVPAGTFEDAAGNVNVATTTEHNLVSMNLLGAGIYWGVVGAAIAVAVPIIVSLVGYMLLAIRDIHPIARTTNLFAILVLSLSLVLLASVGIAGLQKRDISRATRSFSCRALPHFVSHPAILIVTMILARNLKLKFVPDADVDIKTILIPAACTGTINAVIVGMWERLYDGHSFLSRGDSVPWWQCTRGDWGFLWADYALLTILVVVGVVLVMRVSRNEPSYREIKQMSFVFYNIALLGCVAMPVMFLIQNPAGWFVAVSSAMIVDVLAVCSVFIFRLWKAVQRLSNKAEDKMFNLSSITPVTQ
eukprot:c9642_g1_i1.p1 GENE.c9642_g1_i1~~c9642_g1_i1.p1  ORF type:complete len:701 (+),score=168.24 c9642_g1_i1:587-2689(+)